GWHGHLVAENPGTHPASRVGFAKTLCAYDPSGAVRGRLYLPAKPHVVSNRNGGAGPQRGSRGGPRSTDRGKKSPDRAGVPMWGKCWGDGSLPGRGRTLSGHSSAGRLLATRGQSSSPTT